MLCSDHDNFLRLLFDFLFRVRAKSDVLREYQDQTLLMRFGPDTICTFNLNGHIFFASAVKILQQVKQGVLIEVARPQARDGQTLTTSVSASSLVCLADM